MLTTWEGKGPRSVTWRLHLSPLSLSGPGVSLQIQDAFEHTAGRGEQGLMRVNLARLIGQRP